MLSIPGSKAKHCYGTFIASKGHVCHRETLKNNKAIAPYLACPQVVTQSAIIIAFVKVLQDGYILPILGDTAVTLSFIVSQLPSFFSA